MWPRGRGSQFRPQEWPRWKDRLIMSTPGQPLIHLDGVTKVFYTDEVETHALAGIHLEIQSGEFVSIAGPSGCGKSTLLSILGLLDTPSEGTYVLNTRSVADLPLSDWLHFPELQPDWRPHGLRECRTAADVSGHEIGRAQGTRHGRSRKGRHVPQGQAFAQPAFRRSAAARRCGPSRRRVPVDSPR
jgi:energy-coupling factor transporter ATP-binding protein EcfA2